MELEEGFIDEETLLFHLKRYIAARPTFTRSVLLSIANSYELPATDFEAIEDYILQAVPIKPSRITLDLLELTDESRTISFELESSPSFHSVTSDNRQLPNSFVKTYIKYFIGF